MRISSIGPLFAFGAGVLVLGSCSGDNPTAATAPTASVVQVSPGADTLVSVGQTRQLTATIRDAAGNLLSGRTVAWTTNAGTVATVNPSTGLVTAVANGAATITATADGIVGTAQLFVAQLVATVTVTPGNTGLTAIGVTQPFTAVAKDAGGTVVPIGRFIWISSDPSVATVDTLGVATSKHSGQTTITAAGQGVPGNALLSVTQNATQLGYRVAPPITTVAGEAFSRAVQVEIRDAGGAVVSDAQLPVTLTAVGGTLHGTTTVNAINGIASFSGLWMENTGSGLTLSAATGGFSAVTSAAFAITPAPATRVFLANPPVTDTAGAKLNVVVQIRDRFGNTVTSATDSVRVRLQTSPVTGALFGDSAVAALAGVATFSTLNLHLAGPGYTLRVTSAGVDSALSAPFTVKPAKAVKLLFPYSGSNLGVAAGVPFGSFLEISSKDVFGNLSGSHNVTLTVDSIPWAPAHVTGTFTQASVNGVAVFADVALDRPATDPRLYRAIITSPGIASDTTRFFVALPSYQGLFALGATHTCFMAYCWGTNGSGQLGNAEIGARDSVPAPYHGFVPSFLPLAAGGSHTCGISFSPNLAYCWGSNAQGQLGNAAAGTGTSTPTAVSGGTQWFRITAGLGHTCALRASDSTAFCWGDNAAGQGGNGGAPTTLSAPTAVTGGRKFFWIDAGRQHTCGIQVADSVAYCWGRGDHGELGQGVPSNSTTPVAVFGTRKWTAIAAGDFFTCGVALVVGTDVLCWGVNDAGQAGVDTIGVNRLKPGVVIGSTLTVATLSSTLQISAGAAHACVVTSVGTGGNVYCWGSNSDGQIGPNGGGSSPTPVLAVAAGTYDFASVDVGGRHSCAVDTNYQGMYCWGRNLEGQLGIGSTTSVGSAIQRPIQ